MQNVVTKDDTLSVYVKAQRICARIRHEIVAHEIVPVHADVQPCAGQIAGVMFPYEIADTAREDLSTPPDTDQADIFQPLVPLVDLVREAVERPCDRSAVH